MNRPGLAHYLRAVEICRALDPDIRGYAIDAFTDYFRTFDASFPTSWFEGLCRKEEKRK